MPAAPASQTRLPPRALAVFLAVAFLLKLVVLLQLKDHPMVHPDVGLDTSAYVELARRVVAGDLGLGPGLYYVSPLYIYVVAAGLALTDSFTFVRLLQIVLGTAAVGFVLLTAREWFGPRAGWIAGGLAALTGLFTFYEVLLLQAALDPFLTSAALFALTLGLRRDDRRFLVGAGVVLGLAALNRPNMMLAALGVAGVLLVARRMRPALLITIGLVAGMAPAAVRNVVVSGEWTFVSSHGGLNFYMGNNERATGFYEAVPGITPTIVGQQRDARRVAGRALGRVVSDSEASNYFFDRALAWIREHPGAALTLFLRKLGYVLHGQHVALPYSYPFYQYDAATMLRFYVVGPWLLIPLGTIGLIVAAPKVQRLEYIGWAAFVPMYAVAVALFIVAERYRLPMLVPLAIGAAAAIDVGLTRIARREWARVVPAGLAVLAGLVAVNWPLALSDGRWDEGLRMAQRLVILDRLAEARAWTERLEAQAGQPGTARPGTASTGVGQQLLVLDRAADALPFLTRAAEADPGRADTEYALGQALFRTGQVAAAIPHLSRGLDAGTTLPMAGFELALALKDRGDPQGAAAVIGRIRPDDADPEPWLRIGRLAMEIQAPQVAEPFFRRATEIAPAQAGARQQFGLNLLVLGRHAEAVLELGEAVRLNPRDADSLAHLSYGEFQLSRFAEAAEHARAALALDPAHPMARQVHEAVRRIRGTA